MAAVKYNFTMEQGVTLKLEFRYLDSEENPIDLTNHCARMQIKNLKGGNKTYLTLTTPMQPDGTGLDMGGLYGDKPPTSGSIGIGISAYSSSLLDFNRAYYDLEIVSNDQYPVVTRLVEGMITLDKEVTTTNFICNG